MSTEIDIIHRHLLYFEKCIRENKTTGQKAVKTNNEKIAKLEAEVAKLQAMPNALSHE